MVGLEICVIKRTLLAGLLAGIATPALADQSLCLLNFTDGTQKVVHVEYNARKIKVVSSGLMPELNMDRDNDRTSVSGMHVAGDTAYMVIMRPDRITITIERQPGNRLTQWNGECRKV
jgi:hypothetical protein